MADKNILNRILKSPEGFPLIGYIVHWSSSDFAVPIAKLHKDLESLGIDRRIAPLPLAKNALIRAIKTETKGRKDSFHRKVVDESDLAAFAIVDQDVDRVAREVSFETESKVLFNKETKTLQTRGSAGKAIEEKYEKFKEMFTGQQFRTAVLRYTKRFCSAITVREGGGLYFVPAPFEKQLESLEKLFDLYKEHANLTIIPIVDSKQAKKAMWVSLVNEAQADVEKLQKDFEELGRDTTEKAYELRLRRYQEVKNKVEMYETVLSAKADDLRKSLAGLTEAVKRKMVD